MEQYQDIIINGEIKPGVRECESRWEVIKKYLKENFDRPITVLDIGANYGYFSLRILEEFPGSSCVLVESQYNKKLQKLCKEIDAQGVIVLDMLITADDISMLADCEHFDVVLALNVVHHIGEVNKTLEAISRLGDHIILETPGPGDGGACGRKHLKAIYDNVTKAYTQIGSFSRHTSDVNSYMGVLKNNKTTIKNRYWDSEKKAQGISIQSTKTSKTLYNKVKEENRNWIPGINLRTYQYLNGTYPNRKSVTKMLDNLDVTGHPDLTPWNVIISGKQLHLIDQNDPRHVQHTDPNVLREKIKEDLLTEGVNSLEYYRKKK